MIAKKKEVLEKIIQAVMFDTLSKISHINIFHSLIIHH